MFNCFFSQSDFTFILTHLHEDRLLTLKHYRRHIIKMSNVNLNFLKPLEVRFGLKYMLNMRLNIKLF